MPTIESISTRPFLLPLRSALKWGKSSELASLTHVLLEIELSNGEIGRAEIPPRPTIYGETVGTVLAATEYLAKQLIGLEADDQDKIQSILSSFPANHTTKGGFDIALWDAQTNLLEAVPPAQEKIRVSYILGIADPAEMLRDAQEVYEKGVRVLKVKVGRDLEEDLRRLAVLKEKFPDMDLYADANETLTPQNSESYMKAWAGSGLLFVEEPLPVEMATLRQQLRGKSILPIIGDDSTFSVRDLTRELDLNTFDILNIKPARTGFTQSLKMLELVRLAGKSAMVGSQALSSYGAFHTALIGFQAGVSEPSELAFHLKATGSFCEFPEFRNGWLYAADLSVCKFDPEKFAQYEI